MPRLTIAAPSSQVDSVLASVAAYGLAGTRHRLPIAPLEESTWRAFSSKVTEERLAGLLVAAICDNAFPVTDEQVDDAAFLQTEVAVDALVLERLLLVVADRFARDGLDFRVLKGPAVAYLDYPDPSLRCFGDIDLLVRSDDFARAVAVLESEGGRRSVPELRSGFDRRFGKGAVILMPGDLEIDLHRTFVAGPLGMKIDLDGLFATSTPLVLADRELPVLGREERFLHACLHAGLGRPARLLSLRDIAQMSLNDDLDKDRMFEVADSWSARAVVARAVNLTWTTLDLADSIALSAWASRFRPAPNELRVLGAYLRGDQSYTRQAMAALRAIPRGRDRLAYARSHLFPQRSYLDARGAGRLNHLRRATRHLLGTLPR